MSGAIGAMMGRIGYDYDKSGMEPAKKDLVTFSERSIKAGESQKEFAHRTAVAKKGLVDFDAQGKNATARLGKMDVSLSKVGATLGIMGALAGAALGVGIAKSADFEQGIANVGAISESARENIGALTDQAKELGATTAFTSRQAADGMSFLAMAGFEANETISAMPGLLSLASAGGIQLAQAADIASNVLSGFGMGATEAGRVADVLAFGAANANVNVGMLGESMKMVAPVASSMGISLESVSAAAGLLGDAGIQGTMAGTNLRGILLSLAAPTKEAAGSLQKLGVEVFDAQGNMKDMAGIVAEFETNMVGLTDQEKAKALKAIFGKQNIGAFSALLAEGSEKLGEFTQELNLSGGAAQLMADSKLDTLQGSITLFKSATDGAATSVGDIFAPAIRAGVDALTSLVGAFNSAPGPLKTVVGDIAGWGRRSGNAGRRWDRCSDRARPADRLCADRGNHTEYGIDGREGVHRSHGSDRHPVGGAHRRARRCQGCSRKVDGDGARGQWSGAQGWRRSAVVLHLDSSGRGECNWPCQGRGVPEQVDSEHEC